MLNTFLLTLSIGVFFLTINLRQELLLQKILLAQLILSIPLLLTSTLSYSKIGYREKVEKWNLLGWITFVIGYAFLINVVGILVGNVLSVSLSLIFFATSWILTVTYSLVDISYEKTTLKERMSKDLLFILIQIVLGVLVVLKIISF